MPTSPPLCCCPYGASESYEFTTSGFGNTQDCSECDDINGQRVVLGRVVCSWGANTPGACWIPQYITTLAFGLQEDGTITANLLLSSGGEYVATGLEEPMISGDGW